MCKQQSLMLLLALNALAQAWQSVDKQKTVEISSSCDINTPFRPASTENESVHTTLRFNTQSFQGIDDIDKTFTMTGHLQVAWNHPCTSAVDWGNLDLFIINLPDTWVPRISFTNQAYGDASLEQQFRWTGVVFSRGGSVNMLYRNDYIATCDLNFKDFPFDNQHCTIDFVSSLSNRFVTFAVADPTISPEMAFTSNSQVWTFLNYSATALCMEYRNGVCFYKASFEFFVKRRPGIVVITIIIPSTALYFLQYGIIFLHPESESRPMFCCTILVALAVFQSVLSSTIPQTGKIPSIVILITFQMSVTTGLTLYSLVVIALCNISAISSRKMNFTLLTVQPSLLRVIDATTLAAILALSVFGMTFIYSI